MFESSKNFKFLHFQTHHNVMGRIGHLDASCLPHQANTALTEMKLRWGKEKEEANSYQICWEAAHLKNMWKFVSSSALHNTHLHDSDFVNNSYENWVNSLILTRNSPSQNCGSVNYAFENWVNSQAHIAKNNYH